MKWSLVFSAFIFLSSNLIGQDIPEKFRIYKVKVICVDKTFNTKGVLYAVSDTSILISNSVVKSDYISENYEVSEILVNTIEKLKVSRKGRMGKSALIGFASGAVFGALIGYGDGDDSSGWVRYTAEEKALMAGSTWAITGLTIGIIVGAVGKKFTINGNLDNYRKYQNDLMKRSIIKE